MSNHMRRLRVISRFIYKCIIYPFLIGTLLVTMLLLKRQRQLTETSRLESIMCISQAFFTSIVFFYEQKALFTGCIARNRGFMGLSRCHYQYIPIYASFLLIIGIIIKFVYQFEGSGFSAEMLLLICYFAFLTFIIAYGPY